MLPPCPLPSFPYSMFCVIDPPGILNTEIDKRMEEEEEVEEKAEKKEKKEKKEEEKKRAIKRVEDNHRSLESNQHTHIYL